MPLLPADPQYTGPISLVPPERAIWGRPGVDPDLAPDRRRPPAEITGGVIIHTTGYGPGLQRIEAKHGADEAAIGAAFAAFQANNLQYKPHKLVDRTGQLWQLVPLAYRAHHTSGQHRTKYAQPGWAQRFSTRTCDLSWWAKRWPNLRGPLDLPCWAPHPHGPNGRTWAVDLLAPRPGQTWTDAQYTTLARVVAHVGRLLGHPLDPLHVLDHSSACPIDRSNGGGPWDLATNFDWPRFRALLAASAGVPCG